MQNLIVFLVFPKSTLLDLSGPLQVFEDANRRLPEDQLYEIRVVSSSGGAVESDTALPIVTDPVDLLSDRLIDTLIVIGGNHAHEFAQDPTACRVVADLGNRAARVASVCTGAFFLAGAGLLAGRRVTTHWRACDVLAERHPDIQVEYEPIYVHDGKVWTSAGVTAGIDLALALVAEDRDRKFALELARELVTYMVRPGGQLQFSRVLRDQVADATGTFDDLLAWILDNLGEGLRVEQLADHAGMVPRTFARKFGAVFGQTPAKLIEKLRVDKAVDLLVQTDMPIKVIAVHCGFVDDERMRRAFLRQLGTSPQDYRARFGVSHHRPQTGQTGLAENEG